VELDDGERMSYHRLLLATGSERRRLEIPGAELEGVFYLRSVEDSDACASGSTAAERRSSSARAGSWPRWPHPRASAVST